MNGDFIPDKVVGGRFKKGPGAFLSCKYKRQKWVGEGIFTRITGGYKPHLQRDTCVELKKAITDSTFEFDNVPTVGFKVVGYKTNYYGINEFNGMLNVILFDPRGFEVAISVEEFFNLLKITGGNMENSVLKNFECVYVWHPYSSRPHLISTLDPSYLKLKAESDAEIAFKDTTKYLTPTKLVVGACYEGTDNMPGKYVYCGKMDVISKACSNIAVGEESYDVLDILSKKQTDISGKNRLVFFKLGADGSPFVIKNGIAKCFVNSCSYDPKEYKMFDGSGDSTVENIMNAFAECPLFNKIDFARSFKDYEFMPQSMFNLVIHSSSCSSSIFWPYNVGNNRNIVMSAAHAHRPVEILVDSNWSTNVKRWIVYYVPTVDREHDFYSYGSKKHLVGTCEYCDDAIYNLVKPETPIIYYTSGRKMPQRYALFVKPKAFCHTRRYYSAT